jgi:hypothetical protein
MMKIPDLLCWKCGQSVADLPLPLSRTAECRSCRAQLHVCRLCEFFDPHVANQCREPVADFVKEKERANFCDYFSPKPDIFQTREISRTPSARRQLDALFDIKPGNDESDDNLSEAEKARAKLDELFRK